MDETTTPERAIEEAVQQAERAAAELVAALATLKALQPSDPTIRLRFKTSVEGLTEAVRSCMGARSDDPIYYVTDFARRVRLMLTPRSA
jgi:hypothetical protein